MWTLLIQIQILVSVISRKQSVVIADECSTKKGSPFCSAMTNISLLTSANFSTRPNMWKKVSTLLQVLAVIGMTVVITIVDASLPSGPALSTHDHSPSASSAAPKSTIVPIASVPAPLDQCLVLNSATGMTALVDLLPAASSSGLSTSYLSS